MRYPLNAQNMAHSQKRGTGSTMITLDYLNVHLMHRHLSMEVSQIFSSDESHILFIVSVKLDVVSPRVINSSLMTEFQGL